MSKYQALIDALKAGPVEYACHIDGEVDDSCTFDAGQNLYDCVIAQGLQGRGLCKLDCAEWKPISVIKPTIEVKAEYLRVLLADLERAEKALAALAQQAQEREPVAAVLGDIVALWDLYAPSQRMTAMHMHAKRALAGQQPMSPDMHRWCAYVGGMVAQWVMSEPDAHVRLGDDQFEAAIAGIIERRLWAMPKRDTTPQPQTAQQVPEKCLTCSGHGLIGGHLPDGSGHGEPCPDCNAPTVPAPVDELIEALEDLMDWQVKNVALWHNRAYDRANRAIKKHRAALQSPAPQTKSQP